MVMNWREAGPRSPSRDRDGTVTGGDDGRSGAGQIPEGCWSNAGAGGDGSKRAPRLSDDGRTGAGQILEGQMVKYWSNAGAGRVPGVKSERASRFTDYVFNVVGGQMLKSNGLMRRSNTGDDPRTGAGGKVREKPRASAASPATLSAQRRARIVTGWTAVGGYTL